MVHCRVVLDSIGTSLNALGPYSRQAARCALCLAWACSKQQPAPPHNGDTPPDYELLSQPPYFCQEALGELAPNDSAADGFTVAQLSQQLSGEHTTPLTWQAARGGHSYSPGSDRGQLTLSIQVDPGAQKVTRSVGLREDIAEAPQGVTKESLGCLDTVRLSATVSVTTLDGALDETQQVELEVLPSAIATGSLRLPLELISGEFRAELQLPEGFQLEAQPTLDLAFAVAGRTLAGDLELRSGELVSSDGETRRPEVRERIAHFPPGNFCGPEYPVLDTRQMERRAAMAEVLERLNANSPVPLRREIPEHSDTSLELSFANLDQTVCAPTPNDVQEVLLFPATASLVSADGAINGDIGVDVVALANRSEIAARAGASSGDTEFQSTLATGFGITEGLDLSAYVRAAVELEARLDDMGEPAGHLSVLGISACDAFSPTSVDAGLAGAAQKAPDAGTLDTDAGAPPADASAPPPCGSEPDTAWRVAWGD